MDIAFEPSTTWISSWRVRNAIQATIWRVTTERKLDYICIIQLQRKNLLPLFASSMISVFQEGEEFWQLKGKRPPEFCQHVSGGMKLFVNKSTKSLLIPGSNLFTDWIAMLGHQQFFENGKKALENCCKSLNEMMIAMVKT